MSTSTPTSVSLIDSELTVRNALDHRAVPASLLAE